MDYLPPTPPGTVIEIHATARIGYQTVAEASCKFVVRKTWGLDRCYCKVGGGIDPLMNGLMVQRTVDGKTVRGIQTTDGSLF